jgi:hypothetical protein
MFLLCVIVAKMYNLAECLEEFEVTGNILKLNSRFPYTTTVRLARFVQQVMVSKN